MKPMCFGMRKVKYEGKRHARDSSYCEGTKHTLPNEKTIKDITYSFKYKKAFVKLYIDTKAAFKIIDFHMCS